MFYIFKLFILIAFSSLFDPALDFGKYKVRFLFTSEQLTERNAHAHSAKVLRLKTQSNTQFKWV